MIGGSKTTIALMMTVTPTDEVDGGGHGDDGDDDDGDEAERTTMPWSPYIYVPI